MKRLTTVTAALALGVLTGCSAQTPSPADAFLTQHGLGGMEPSEIVEHLDSLGGAERPTELMASVRPDELLLSDGVEEVSLALPEDEFYLSLAPYVEQTHDCFFHSLTTCQGELVGEDVEVTVLDDAGEVILDEAMTTQENGFVGMWLPRDVTGTIEVTADGRTGTVPFSTDDDGATCLTTLQLA
ncbi:CueP family metal-binding protein [Georgenia sp. MJ206]|uniref:CueP family metal-binding protein n=1 Tax=Georgenia wangjunii TaxID=3117730 RepID=UPI002F262762